VAVVDAFFRQPFAGVAEVGQSTARAAAALVADGRFRRLPDALIAATAMALDLPVFTGDLHLARAAPNAFLVADLA
jgi:predicted nucleic acid-binding protein